MTPLRDQEQFVLARRDFWRALVTAVLYNLLGIAGIEGYIGLVFGWETMLRFLPPVAIMSLLGIAVAHGLGYWVIRDLPRFLLANDAGAALAGLDDRQRKQAANMPLNYALIAFFTWQIFGQLLSLYVLFSGDYDPRRVFVHSSMGALFAGQLTAIFVFYTVEHQLSLHLMPLLFRERRVSDVQGVVGVPTYVRIGFLILTTAIGPMLYIWSLELLGELGGDVLVYFLLFGLVNGAGQAAFLMRTISQPIGRLAGRFGRFRRGEEVADEPPVLRGDALGRLSEMFDDLVDTMEERDFIRTTFGRYVSQQIVDAILDGQVELGGSRLEATVLFADIRGFTRMSEELPPEAVVAFLNEYLDQMVQAIAARDGIPDKFIGDGILAVWGVPVGDTDHRAKAVRAALDMLAKLATLNERRRRLGAGPIEVGIAVHSGELIAGNIGSQKKMEFTVIGDTVNTCARIEGRNKELGSALTISEAVHAGLPTELARRFERRTELELRGKRRPVTLYTVAETPGHKAESSEM